MTMPNFLIIGAGKSGTTSLHYYLQQHPQVFMSPQKETYFFIYEGQTPNYQGPRDDKLINRQAVTHIESYQALFDGVKDEVAIGEACPRYLSYAAEAAPHIQQRIPAAKIIVILRNPVDRAFSSYLMQVREGRETLSFAEAIASEKTRLSNNWAWGQYVSSGCYAAKLDRYFERFPPEQIRVYLFEDLQSDIDRLLQNLFSFLGVEESFKPDMTIKYNVSGQPKSSALHTSLHTSIQSFHRFMIGDSAVKQGIKSLLPQSVLQSFNDQYEAARSHYFQRNLTKPQLSLDLRQQLIETFREDILRLQDRIQRDLSYWLVP
ncbi:MAG: sulfotransferase [Phormidesmis sp.]